MTWDYAFIGAGPASMVAASSIASGSAARVIVLEAGRPMRHRGCPGRKASNCTSCFGGLCHVTQGIGGSSAIFGNKLCHFPASEGVRELIGAPDLGAVNGAVAAIFDRVEQQDRSNVVPRAGRRNRKVYD